MLITGYDGGPLVPGEALAGRPGFWSTYLMALCGDGRCAERPVPEWFGEDGADADALSEVLFDPERWPVFRVPASVGPGAVVIYRNLHGDHGTDYLLTHPGRGPAEQIARWEGDFSGTGLTWRELTRTADNPSPADEGVQGADVQGAAVRLLLLLPLLSDPLLTDPDGWETASARVVTALTAVGAPHGTVRLAAEHLLDHLAWRSRHDPAWSSPLSGG
ncbi:hypothetical protein [Streptomyces sp. NPDC002640]